MIGFPQERKMPTCRWTIEELTFTILGMQSVETKNSSLLSHQLSHLIGFHD